MLRSVAVFEAAKGTLVLLVGGGLFSLLHQNIQALAERVVAHFHLDPAGRYPRIFVDLAAQLNDARLWMLAGFALLYAVVRFIEAYGLWHARRWAEWFAALSGGIYIPFEVHELFERVNWLRVLTLLANVLIVLFMIYGLRHADEIAAEQAE
ncbi:MAG: DUF2127 domain-containing protein [Steroidobacteraceae bacterium]